MQISSILPVYNSKEGLARAIESFLSQSFDSKELVIVDGNSTDGSHDIIEEYQDKYPDEIKWIREKDRGLSNARNIGVGYASGELVGFLAADDILHRGIFEKIGYYMGMLEFDVLYCSALIYNASLRECFPGHKPFKKLNKKNLLRCNPIAPGECFYYRRGIFDRFRFNEGVKYCMDYEFNLQLTCSDADYIYFGMEELGLIGFLGGDNISCKYGNEQDIEARKVRSYFRGQDKSVSLVRRFYESIRYR